MGLVGRLGRGAWSRSRSQQSYFIAVREVWHGFEQFDSFEQPRAGTEDSVPIGSRATLSVFGCYHWLPPAQVPSRWRRPSPVCEESQRLRDGYFRQTGMRIRRGSPWKLKFLKGVVAKVGGGEAKRRFDILGGQLRVCQGDFVTSGAAGRQLQNELDADAGSTDTWLTAQDFGIGDNSGIHSR